MEKNFLLRERVLTMRQWISEVEDELILGVPKSKVCFQPRNEIFDSVETITNTNQLLRENLAKKITRESRPKGYHQQFGLKKGSIKREQQRQKKDRKETTVKLKQKKTHKQKFLF